MQDPRSPAAGPQTPGPSAPKSLEGQAFVPPPPPPPPLKPPVRPPHKENIKETIESILIAFILAFVFRAFVVEAFVIPSGSMAPTLLGAHMRFHCEECGYEFTANYPVPQSKDDSLNIPARAGQETNPPAIMSFPVHCPNCGFKVRRQDATQAVPPPPESCATTPPVYYGDRILVLKYSYLLKEPRRWDVVVFKSPTYPGTYDYGQNFIKRLVGKPGETLMVLNGDVYTCPNNAADKTSSEKIEDWPWQVQTKPRDAQEALWRVVYDNDFLPQNAPIRANGPERWTMPWKPASGSGWDTGTPQHGRRTFQFTNAAGPGTLYFDRDANSGAYSFTDWLPYDETKIFGSAAEADYSRDAYGREQMPRWNVSDAKVQFFYERQQGDGPFRVSLTKLDDTFVAEIHPASARLLRQVRDASGKVVAEEQVGADQPIAGGPLHVEFQNVDYRVSLRLNGRDVLQTTPQDYAPDVKDLLRRHYKQRQLAREGMPSESIRMVFPPPRIELSAEKQGCAVSHLSLWRDVHYTPSYRGYLDALEHAGPEKPVRLHRRGDEPGVDNEYFVLGDNSILSSDARDWRDPVHLLTNEDLAAQSGCVPERFLLGKAFFVYWPAGYRPLGTDGPGIIPSFGKMRFIH